MFPNHKLEVLIVTGSNTFFINLNIVHEVRVNNIQYDIFQIITTNSSSPKHVVIIFRCTKFYL